ncbi:hypothetical protein [Bacillus sp. FJAT-22090]|uniref:hypothetical protein n=1 Tax=Bacillus sp. FJAT-22090 TaxID=1581038 RepID=UPI00119D7A9E|nr:hypothetical protein [Bacillus sp. FJAT-22090]
MPDIRTEDLLYLENKLYLPMIIKVLEKDLDLIDKLPFKLKRPYIKIVEDALKLIRKDLKSAEMYLIRNSMKVFRWERDSESTTYVFLSGGVEDHRRFLNTEIKAKCDLLMAAYLVQ